MTALSAALDLVESGQVSVSFIPRDGIRGRRPVILCHNIGGTAQYFNDANSPGAAGIGAACGAAGLPCVSTYQGGPSWGIDASTAPGGLVDNALAYMVTLGCAASGALLVGISMGCITALRYAILNPSKVYALILALCVCDLDDMRDNDRGGRRASINTAYGFPVGGTSATNPFAANVNPSSTANAATIATTPAVVSGRTRLYYSTADATVIPATVTAFGTKLGIVPTVIDTTLGHTDAALLGVPYSDMVSALAAAA